MWQGCKKYVSSVLQAVVQAVWCEGCVVQTVWCRLLCRLLCKLCGAGWGCGLCGAGCCASCVVHADVQAVWCRLGCGLTEAQLLELNDVFDEVSLGLGQHVYHFPVPPNPFSACLLGGGGSGMSLLHARWY